MKSDPVSLRSVELAIESFGTTTSAAHSEGNLRPFASGLGWFRRKNIVNAHGAAQRSGKASQYMFAGCSDGGSYDVEQ